MCFEQKQKRGPLRSPCPATPEVCRQMDQRKVQSVLMASRHRNVGKGHEGSSLPFVREACGNLRKAGSLLCSSCGSTYGLFRPFFGYPHLSTSIGLLLMLPLCFALNCYIAVRDLSLVFKHIKTFKTFQPRSKLSPCTSQRHCILWGASNVTGTGGEC